MKIEEKIQKLVILDYYKTNLKVKEIAHKYNLCRQSIRNIIIKNKKLLKSKQFEKLKHKIILEYSKGKTNKELSLKYNVHRTTIQRIIKNSNQNLRTQSETARKHNLINFNSGILSNNDAYILGLIYADGNLFKNVIDIRLHEKDKEILLKISKYVYGKNTLKYSKSKKWLAKNGKTYTSDGQWRFTISSKQVTSILRKVGLTENKSLTIRFPKLKSEFISHFIRGYFDGDGCIFVSKKYKNTNRVTMVSNYLFCEDLKYQIEKFLKINACVQYKTENVGTLSISGNKQIITFMDWIYQDANLKLNRKYQKYITELKNKK